MSCGCTQIQRRLKAELGARRFRSAARTAAIGCQKIASNIKRSRKPSVIRRR